jgi:hypothetical protein
MQPPAKRRIDRRTIVGVSVILFWCLIAGVLVYLWFAPGCTQAQAMRIQRGMTEAEVHAILGGMPEDPDTFGWLPWRKNRATLHVPGAVTHQQWTGRNGRIVVGFDADGRALLALWLPN